MFKIIQENEEVPMTKYLNSLIYEQINRVDSLKKRIEKPLEYPELSGLKERLLTILTEQTGTLNSCLSELQENPQKSDYRHIFRITRGVIRKISSVETYGIAALEYQTSESAFLNTLLFKIHQEIEFPLPAPAICCISTNYYFTVPFANVILVPLLEPEFLLHLPDLYHEMGHLVARNREKISKIQCIRDSFDEAFTRITEYYTNLINEKSGTYGPDDIPRAIRFIHEQWKSWLDEFFCDLFALYTLGPAFAWSHLHLSAKTSEDIHRLWIIVDQEHPADEARMRMLYCGLRLLGFTEEIEKIDSEWKKVKQLWGDPIPEYEYAYPESLIEEIAKIFLEGIKKSGFTTVDKEILEKNDSSFRSLLNKAWKNFWELGSEEFRNWEKEQIDNLRKNLVRCQ